MGAAWRSLTRGGVNLPELTTTEPVESPFAALRPAPGDRSVGSRVCDQGMR